MARDPLEGIRPPDIAPRPGIPPAAGSGPAGARLVVLALALIAMVVVGFVTYVASAPKAAPIGGVQGDRGTPSPSPSSTSLVDPPATHR